MNEQPPDILSHAEAGVLTLTFNRLDKKNSITTAMYAALAEALAAAKDDDAVRAVVIQGHELVFSAGNDLGDFLDNPPSAGEDAPVWRFMFGLAGFPKPVVAAVCGAAVGIGATMLLHCDLVYAGDNAVFSLPFVNLGLCPEFASTLLLPQRAGHLRAAEALMLGEPFTAERALEMGLVNRIVAPSEANALAQAQALRLAAKPARALLETKRLMKSAQVELVTRQIGSEGRAFGELLQEPAAREAFAAFMEKRKPDSANPDGSKDSP